MAGEALTIIGQPAGGTKRRIHYRLGCDVRRRFGFHWRHRAHASGKVSRHLELYVHNDMFRFA
jgi:hypothetical protein